MCGILTRMMLPAAGVLILMAAAACSDEGPQTTQSPSPTIIEPSTSPPPSPSQPPSTENDIPPYAFLTNAEGETVALLLEIADTAEERSVGLMNRGSLPEDQGMLFDFQAEVQAGFWMKNTLIPLSIAFIDSDGVIVHIEDMEPQTEEIHNSPRLYRYAIEVNQGWYAERAINAGDRVELRVGS